MKEYDNLLKISKGFVDKKNHKKIKSFKDKEERMKLLKFLIISKIKLMQLELELLLKNSKEIEDFEVLLLKTSNLSYKIKLLEHNLNEKDFKKIIILINEIKKKVA
jgi:hypothetical protein